MTIHNDFIAPWTLFRGDTDDYAAILDANGDELVRSRFFWLPEEGEPETPPTLAAMMLMKAAPKLLAALGALLPYAQNEAECLESLKDGPEAEVEAERAWHAIAAAEAAIAEATPARPLPAAPFSEQR